MPRVAVAGFVGPSNTQVSRTLDAERTINLIQQSPAPGTARAAEALINRPGLRPFATYPGASSIRALFWQNSRAFVVASSSLVELFADGTFGTAYTLVNDGLPATICSNGSAGNQLFITSGSYGYIYDLSADTLTQITDSDFLTPARRGEFMDGYFLNFQGDNSRSFQWSALEDGLTWSGLDVAERSIGSDSIRCMIRNHRELWIMGTQTSEVWYDSGDASTPFQPIQGVFVEHGCEATRTVCRVDNTLIWVGRDVDGAAVVWRADGYTPRRVSTSAVERALQSVVQTQANAWTCQIQGHAYYVLISPTLDTSWVYDLSMDRWYEWAHWDPVACEWVPFRPWNHMYAFDDRHLVGDRLSGTIYEFTPTVYTDYLVDV